MSDKTVRVHVDFPADLYRALLPVTDKLGCSIGTLAIRMASRALTQPPTEAAVKKAESEAVALIRKRLNSEITANRRARDTITEMRATVKDANARTRRAEALAASIEPTEVQTLRTDLTAARRRAAAEHRHSEALDRKLRETRKQLTETRRQARTATTPPKSTTALAVSPSVAKKREHAAVDVVHVTRLHTMGATAGCIASGLSLEPAEVRAIIREQGLPSNPRGRRAAELQQTIDAEIRIMRNERAAERAVVLGDTQISKFVVGTF